MVRVMMLSKEQQWLIALGEYLYRFKDENGSTPKGLPPIAVAIAYARITSNDHVDNEEFSVVYDLSPAGCNDVFEISSIGK